MKNSWKNDEYVEVALLSKFQLDASSLQTFQQLNPLQQLMDGSRGIRQGEGIERSHIKLPPICLTLIFTLLIIEHSSFVTKIKFWQT